MAQTAAFHEAPVGFVGKVIAAAKIAAAVLADAFKLRARMSRNFDTAD